MGKRKWSKTHYKHLPDLKHWIRYDNQQVRMKEYKLAAVMYQYEWSCGIRPAFYLCSFFTRNKLREMSSTAPGSIRL
jgi:hypothetical protein